jgi:hypothetical protein
MNLSFELRNSADMLGKLKFDAAEYLADNESSYKALNYAMTAWHLSEWVYHEFKASEFNTLSKFQEALKLKCPEIQIAHDISNGSKHYKLNRHYSQTLSTKYHRGFFSSDFYSKDFFDVSGLVVEMRSGEQHYFTEIVMSIRDFWLEYFLSELSIRIKS